MISTGSPGRAPPSPESELPPALVIGLFFLCQVCNSFGFMTAPVINPVAAPAIGVSPEWIGVYGAISTVASAATSLGLSGITRRIGAVRSVQVSLAVVALGLLGLATGNLVLVIASSLLHGAAVGVAMPAASAALGRAIPSHRLSVAFGIVQTGFPLGFAATGATLPSVVVAFGWQAACLFSAAVVCIPVVALQCLRHPIDSGRDPSHPWRGGSFLSPLRMVWGHPPLRTIGIAALLLMGIQSSLMSYSVSYLVVEMGRSLVIAGGVMTTAQLVTAASRVAIGWLGDRIARPMRLVAALSLASAVASGVIGFSSPAWSTPVLAVSMVLMTTFAQAWTGIYLSSIARNAPNGEIGVATAGAQVFNMTGSSIAPLLFGAVSAGGQFTNGFLLVAVVSAFSGCWLLRAGRVAPRP